MKVNLFRSLVHKGLVQDSAFSPVVWSLTHCIFKSKMFALDCLNIQEVVLNSLQFRNSAFSSV